MAVDKNKISAEASKLVQKGQYDKAIKAYQRIIAADPGDLRVLLKVGELHQKKGDSAGAAQTFGRVAEAYASQGFFLKSVAVYKQMAKLAPEDASVNERLAALYQQLGLVSEAMSQLQLVAEQIERGGDEKKHLDCLRRIVELDPDDTASAIKLGDAYARQSQPKLALEQFRRAAEVLKRNSRSDEYVRVAERIAAIQPDDLTLSRELAGLLLARGDTKRALSKLQRCFKADPKNLQTLELLARAFEDLGQTSKVVAVFRELARLHADGGRLAPAQAAWRKVLDLAPEDTEALGALAPAGADAHADVAIAATAAEPTRGESDDVTPGAIAPPPPATAEPPAPPEDAPPPPAAESGQESIAKLLGETDVYVKYGLHDRALAHLDRIFEVDPDQLDAREKASRVRELKNDAAGAAEEALRAARIALATGLHDRARTALDRVRALAPGHPGLAELEPGLETPGGDHDGDDGVVLEIELDRLEAEGDQLAIAGAASSTDEVVEEEDGLDSSVRPEPVEGRRQAASADDDQLRQDLAEVDFFIGQRLLEDARQLLEDLRASYPDHAGIEARLQEIALQPATDAVPEASSAVEPASSEESATHYDLGIAYKEMGLLDEALHELELALDGAAGGRQADCLAMIGLCRLEKGDPAGAIEACRRGLRLAGLTPIAIRELRYQLAAAHEAAGDADSALWYLHRVVESEPGYRETEAALLRLGGGAGQRPEGDPGPEASPPVRADSTEART